MKIAYYFADVIDEVADASDDTDVIIEALLWFTEKNPFKRNLDRSNREYMLEVLSLANSLALLKQNCEKTKEQI